jgi:hypothetical protein
MSQILTTPDCLLEPPHIVADPCRPRWVVKCSHGNYFYANEFLWTDKRDEKGAMLALKELFWKMRNEHP